MTDSSNPSLQPSAAADFRRAKHWFFKAGEGLVIQCRHLTMQGFMVAGALPTPVFDLLSTRWGAGISASVAARDPQARVDLLTVATAYACEAAISPRMVMADHPDAGGSDVLTVSVDPEASDLPHDVLIDLMNEGMTRRLGFDARSVATFSGNQPQPGAPRGSDGAAVSPAAELMAVGGDERSH